MLMYSSYTPLPRLLSPCIALARKIVRNMRESPAYAGLFVGYVPVLWCMRRVGWVEEQRDEAQRDRPLLVGLRCAQPNLRLGASSHAI